MTIATIPAFTPTRLLTYKRCPLEYRNKYVERVPVAHEPDPVLARATTAHAVLRQLFDHYRRTRAFPIDLRARVEAQLPVDPYPEPAAWRADVELVLGFVKTALAAFDGSAEVLAVEQTFEYPFPGSPLVPRFTLRATVDLLLRHPDNSLEILDWKTGASVWVDEIQAVASRIVVAHRFPGETIRSTTAFVATGALRSELLTREDVLRVWREIKEIVAAIQGGAHWPPTSNPLCPRCPFYQNACTLYPPPSTTDAITRWLEEAAPADD